MISFGIFLCELFNGAVPFSDLGVGTLIMLEKLRGKQPLLMDKSTLESNPLFTEDEKYIPFLKRKIPKTWHLLISTLTTRCPEKRPTAKAVLKVNFLYNNNLSAYVECNLFLAKCLQIDTGLSERKVRAY